MCCVFDRYCNHFFLSRVFLSLTKKWETVTSFFIPQPWTIIKDAYTILLISSQLIATKANGLFIYNITANSLCQHTVCTYCKMYSIFYDISVSGQDDEAGLQVLTYNPITRNDKGNLHKRSHCSSGQPLNILFLKLFLNIIKGCFHIKFIHHPANNCFFSASYRATIFLYFSCFRVAELQEETYALITKPKKEEGNLLLINNET